MAGSDTGSSEAQEPLNLNHKINKTIPRRKLTLITITVLLNILTWSTLISLTASIVQTVSDSADTTSIAPLVLTSTSALASFIYVLTHTTFSCKQKVWELRQQITAAVDKTFYFAIRLAASSCALWLLTSGWNMILVARRPICLQKAPGLQSWEYGTTCQWSRVSIAFAAIALLVMCMYLMNVTDQDTSAASCALFGMLAVTSRPFEAHVFKHGYRQPAGSSSTPFMSRTNTASPSMSRTSEKYERGRVRRRSTSIGSDNSSHSSNTNPSTINLSNNPPPMSYHSRTSSSLSRPPPVFVQPSIQTHYAPSTWRAIHPAASTMPVSRSYSHSRSASSSYQSIYSRSSISLTRPRRLTYASPPGTASSSGSSRPDSRDEIFSGQTRAEGRATASEIAFALVNGTAIPGTLSPKDQNGHSPTISVPNATYDAPQPYHSGRLAKAWKPQSRDTSSTKDRAGAAKHLELARSSSVGFLDRFSPDSSPGASPNNDIRRPYQPFGSDNPNTRNVIQESPKVRQLRSARKHSRISSAPTPAEAAQAMVMQMPDDLQTNHTRSKSADAGLMMRLPFESIKNKPLPRIAIL
ncbi:Golgi vesicle transport [Pyrenophora seminiperda CCB06]|uniref:Golgi vesicle transport n=1 Tax=Pyrenophora seminiperda CCB06 TaxID=1302712 RepID=A0A3M7M0V8_9PLEO|nr:Golgi vesicle transport [Pyrenophora seminiperda CCB06]